MNIENLVERFSARIEPQPLVVCLSGGVDSALLAWLCTHVYPSLSSAVIFDMPFVSAMDIVWARQTAKETEIDVAVIELDPLSVPEVAANVQERCYYCKKHIFGFLRDKYGPEYLFMDGVVADDAPNLAGQKAYAEIGAISPLALLGLDKSQVRKLAKDVGLSAHDRPANSCLATRFPAGRPFDRAELRVIESAEDILRSLELESFRTRFDGCTMKIEYYQSGADLDSEFQKAVRESILPLGVHELRFKPWR